MSSKSFSPKKKRINYERIIQENKEKEEKSSQEFQSLISNMETLDHEPIDDQDEDNCSPIFKKFRENKENCKILTNFYDTEILEIFNIVQNSMYLNQKRGRKHTLSLMDQVFIVLVQLKNAEYWNKFAVD